MRRHTPADAVLPAILFLLACLPASALWKSLKSDSFTLFYPSGREQAAWQALQELEQWKAYATALVGGSGERRLWVVLVDAGTQSNGFADPAYRRLHLYLYPPSDPELGFAPSWWSGRKRPSCPTSGAGAGRTPSGSLWPGWCGSSWTTSAV